jgi:hypothetical protein
MSVVGLAAVLIGTLALAVPLALYLLVRDERERSRTAMDRRDAEVVARRDRRGAERAARRDRHDAERAARRKADAGADADDRR